MFSRPYLPIGLYSQGTVLQLLRMFLVHYIFTVLSGSYVIILMFPVFQIFPAPYTPRTLDLLRVLCSQGPVFLNPYVPKGRYFQDPHLLRTFRIFPRHYVLQINKDVLRTWDFQGALIILGSRMFVGPCLLKSSVPNVLKFQVLMSMPFYIRVKFDMWSDNEIWNTVYDIGNVWKSVKSLQTDCC